MAYDNYLPNNWWGTTAPTGMGAGFGPNGAIPFDQRGLTPAGAAPNAPAAPQNTTPVLPDYSQIQNIIQQINATNQQAQSASNAARIPNAPALERQSSQNIMALLNPPSQYGELDVPAASRAVASGTVGSPFAGVTGLNLTRTQQMADRAEGAQQLNMAYARNPGAPIANPEALVQMLSQQMYGAGQNQLNRDLQERIANAEMANRALQNRRNIAAYNNRSGSYGPSLPTDYGRPGMGAGTVGGNQTHIPEDPNRFGPYQLPPASPNIGGLENWNQLGTFRQDEYNRMLSQNPYFGLPDSANPYSGDEFTLPAYNDAGNSYWDEATQSLQYPGPLI